MFIEGWPSSRSAMQTAAKKKIISLPGIKTPDVQPEASHFSDWIISTHAFHKRCYMHKQTNKEKCTRLVLSHRSGVTLKRAAFPTEQICLHTRHIFFIIYLCFISTQWFTYTNIDDRNMFTN